MVMQKNLKPKSQSANATAVIATEKLTSNESGDHDKYKSQVKVDALLKEGPLKSTSAEQIRENCRKLISKLYLMQPKQVGQISDFVQKCLEMGHSQAVLESLVLVTKSNVFNFFSSWNCLVAMKLLSKAVVYYHTRETDKRLTDKQATIFASTFELLFSSGLKRMRKKDFYLSFKNCLLETFSKCLAMLEKCSESSQNAAESPKELNFLALHLTVNQFKKENVDLKLCAKSLGFLSSSGNLEGQKSLCTEVLNCYDYESFVNILWPELKRALTRHAEKALPSVCEIMKTTKIDFSEKLSEFFNAFFDFLIAQSSEVSLKSAEVFSNLFKHCSQWEFVDKLSAELCAIYAGKSEKKLSSATQKQLILDILSQMSSNAVPESKIDQLASNVLINLSKLVKTNDPLVLQTGVLNCMLAWVGKFSKKISPEFLGWLKAPTCNQASPQTQTILAKMCLKLSEKPRFEEQVNELIPLRIEFLTKQQNATLTLNLFHDLSVDLLLLSKFAENEDSKALTVVKNFLGKIDLLNSIRVLKVQPSTNLREIILLLEHVILRLEHLIKPDVVFLSILCILALHRSHSIRAEALKVLKKVANLFEVGVLVEIVTSTVREIWSEYYKEIDAAFFEREFVPDISKVSKQKENARVLYELIFAIVSSDWHIQSKRELCAEFLTICNQDEVKICGKNWKHLCDSCSIPNSEQGLIVTRYVLARESVETLDCAVLQASASGYGKSFVQPILSKVLSFLEDCCSKQVTKENYEIFKTAEGTVYDLNVWTDVSRIDQESKNVKREDKGMSWKEEKAFRELSKELKVKEKKLTKKQQDIVDKALARESAIRADLKCYELKVSKTCEALRALFKGAPELIAANCHLIIPVLAKLCAIHIATFHAQKLIHEIGALVVTETALSQKWNSLSQAVFRIAKAPEIKEELKFLPKDVLGCAEIVMDYVKSEVFQYQDDAIRSFQLPINVFNLFHPTFHESIYALSEDLVTSSAEKYDVIEAVVAIFDVQLSETSVQNSAVLPVSKMFNSLFHVLQEFPPAIQVKAKQVSRKLCALVFNSKVTDPKLTENLYQSLLRPSVTIQSSVLESCDTLASLLVPPINDFERSLKLFTLIYALTFDEEPNISKMAAEIWNKIPNENFEAFLPEQLLEIVSTECVSLNKSASIAMGKVIENDQSIAAEIFDDLITLFQAKITFVPAKKDTLGRIISEEVPDVWEPRLGVAECLKQVVKFVPESILDSMFEFFLQTGLDDTNEQVRQGVLNAAQEALDVFGQKNCRQFLKVLQDYMDNENGSVIVKQSVVILMGSLAKHMMDDQAKIKPIVSKLMESLSEPSPLVQEAVANCLPKLVDAIRDDCPELISKLLTLLLTTEDPCERRGAAFGVAGLVKGLGIMSLKQLQVISQLQEAIEDKKSWNRRIGALLGFQSLCLLLGRIFEPYLVTLLPHLLIAFGDPQKQVRDMAEETSKVVMQKLTVHGVKIVLPTLLKGLEEESWRTKVGCIELLGAMSHCAPKQLSACLPTIVPKLLEVLNDSHHKVAACAKQALNQVASVVKNPEIQGISADILKALSNTADETKRTLQILLKTRFVHMIDAASLALIMPILENSFKDRSAEVRKMGCQILCNINTLSDSKDLKPYLDKLIPGFKTVLIDPVPEIRAHSSRALGSLVRGIGDCILEVMMPWLRQTVVSSVSNIDRSGAAQGLSEVYAAIGPSKLQEILPQIVCEAMNVDHPPHVRDGYLSIFIFLPLAFGSHFASYVDQIIPAVLQGLASEVEYVRDSSFKAGQQIINQYSTTSLAIFLPELDKGLFDENWRIRLSSIQLLGDLLFKLLGVTGKMSTETEGDDDTFGTEKTNTKLSELLTLERRDRVLGGLYMGRNDVSLPVRQASLHVWKIVVSNTPRTLKEILPTLFSLLLGNLACDSEEKKQIAARTLGDLAKKLGDRVLPEIIPVLERGLKSPDTDHRQGVCIGLGEVMASTSRDQVQQYLSIIVPTVEMGLCDPFERVRIAAAKAFDKLYNIIHQQALEEVLKPLIPKLTDGIVGEYATDGLKQVIAIRSRSVMPFLIPELTKPPANVAALAIIAPVAGETLNNHLEKILPALVTSLTNSENEDEDLKGMVILFEQIEERQAVAFIVEHLLGVASERAKETKSLAGLKLFNSFVTTTEINLSDFCSEVFKVLLSLLANESSDDEFLMLVYDILTKFVKKLDSAEQIGQLFNIRQAVRQASQQSSTGLIKGLCVAKKGIGAILPIYRESIMNGSQESKEQAAYGLSEAIKVTTAGALQHLVIQITGPLIRILGERYSVNVRIAFLSTLNLLLNKVGVMLKPFLPQLQNTFMKAISDPNERVKIKGAEGVGLIMAIHLRPDPIFTELLNIVQNSPDVQAQSVALNALQQSVKAIGPKMNPAIRDKIFAEVLALRQNESEDFRKACGGCLGMISGFLPEQKLNEIMKDVFLNTSESKGIDLCHSNAVALSICCKNHSEKLFMHKDCGKLFAAVRALSLSKNILLSQAG